MSKRKLKKVTQKDSIFKRIIRRYNFKLLKNKIEAYGFEYSFKKFLLQFLGVLAAMTAIAYYLKVSVAGLMLMFVEVAIAFPFIIDAQFGQLNQIKRFEMVRDYIGNILPIFKNKPKIAMAWNEMLDLVDGEMKVCVQNALNYLMTNIDDPDVEMTAFKFIEEKFPNSRIHSIHQMMYTIENKNSEDYFSSIDNMYYDSQAWISRVYGFQKEVAKYRKDLIILCVFGLLCSSFSVGIFGDHEIFNGYTDNIAYQTVTTIYVMAMILCICLSYIKMNGSWLVDDRTLSNEKSYYKSFDFLMKNKKEDIAKKTKKYLVISIILVVYGVISYAMNPANMNILLLCVLVAYLIYSQGMRRYNMHFRKVKFFLEVEYPIWMRDVALNLYNYTVLNAIEESKTTCSEIFAHYIDLFLEDAYEHPSSIGPYNRFLEEFNIEGVKSSMKVFFSLKSLTEEQVQEQVNSLILRNQELLEHSERMKNDDMLSGVKLLGFVPTMLLMLHLVASMGIMFTFIINKLMTMI